MTWDPPAGTGVDLVRKALQSLREGTGTYEDVREAVSGATFAVRPTATSVDELAENWDYQVMEDTATDTLQVALFQRTLTLPQFRELMDLAKYTGTRDAK
jgi:hypothetical protein